MGMLCAVIVCIVSASCSKAPREEIIAGTVLVKGLVQDIAGEDAAVRALIPPGMCPGHFDMKPSDVDALAACKVFLVQSWQRKMANVSQLVKTAGIPAERIVEVGTDGNWMVPPLYSEAVGAVAQALAVVEPGMAALYEQRAAERAKAVEALGAALKKRLDAVPAGGVKVMCGQIQEPLVRWAGFEIVDTYGRPEDLSVADVERLVKTGRDAKVAVVVDNLQSGDTRVSQAFAREIGAVHVVLSNFPGGLPDTDTWDKACTKNVDLLLDAAARSRAQDG